MRLVLDNQHWYDWENHIRIFIDLLNEIVNDKDLIFFFEKVKFCFVALVLPPEHRFEPGELGLGRSVNYPVRKIYLDPFRRQIFTEDIEYEDSEPYLLTLKLAPKFFLPILSQVAKS